MIATTPGGKTLPAIVRVEAGTATQLYLNLPVFLMQWPSLDGRLTARARGQPRSAIASEGNTSRLPLVGDSAAMRRRLQVAFSWVMRSISPIDLGREQRTPARPRFVRPEPRESAAVPRDHGYRLHDRQQSRLVTAESERWIGYAGPPPRWPPTPCASRETNISPHRLRPWPDIAI